MKTKLKKLPVFKSEDEERAFWATHDSTEYIDVSKLQLAEFPKLRRSKESNLFKIDADIAEKLRAAAKSRHLSTEKYLEQLIVKNLDRLSSGRRAAL
jgi:hypothetical protein